MVNKPEYIQKKNLEAIQLKRAMGKGDQFSIFRCIDNATLLLQ